MSLKSSNKTDVNTTELVISIDAEAFEAAVEKEYQHCCYNQYTHNDRVAERDAGQGRNTHRDKQHQPPYRAQRIFETALDSQVHGLDCHTEQNLHHANAQ